MYKNIELLNKKEHQELYMNKHKSLDFAKNLSIITLGLSEVSKLSSLLPILISGGDKQEFIAINKLGNVDGFFSKTTPNTIFIPKLLKSYPFLMIDSHEENNKDRKYRAIAIDIDKEYVGENKEVKLFKDQKYLNDYPREKVNFVQQLEKDRSNSQRLINELKKYNLLDERSIDIKLENGNSKTILSGFYVVNKEKLYNLDDDILVKWTKNNWIYYIVSHIESIENIQNIIKQDFVKKNS